MNSGIEHIDYKNLYEIGVRLFHYSSDVRESLNKIDSYIKGINDDKVWKGKGRDAIIAHYLKERENLALLYLKLVDYSKFILKMVQSTEEFTGQVTKILEGLNDNLLWLT